MAMRTKKTVIRIHNVALPSGSLSKIMMAGPMRAPRYRNQLPAILGLKEVELEGVVIISFFSA
jgi:hypothetical protein